MRAKCLAAWSPQYHNYGAKGITVCASWRDSFLAFYRDMGPRNGAKSLVLKPGATEYAPGNCYWSRSMHFALNNYPKPQVITHNGETLTLREWASRLGLPVDVLYQRVIYQNWPTDKAFSTPVRSPQQRGKPLVFRGESLTFNEWSLRTGISVPTLRKRLKKGWSIERALTTPTYASERLVKTG
jgi:hypothetical protein